MLKRRWHLSLLGLLGLLGACTRQPVDALAWVDGSPITRAELELQLRFQGSPQPLSSVAEEALQDLIDRSLLIAGSKALGARISETDRESALRLALAGSDTQAFRASLEERGLSWEQWAVRVEQDALIADGVQRALRGKVEVSGQAIKDYYWEHVPEFRRPPQMKLRQIFTRSRRQAELAQRELQLGDPFEEVARKRSVGAEAAQGGDLGLMSERKLPKALMQAAAKLKPGQVSPILATAWGWHLLLLEEKRAAFGYSLEQAAPRARSELQRDLEQPLYQEWLASLRQRAKIVRVEQGPSRPAS